MINYYEVNWQMVPESSLVIEDENQNVIEVKDEEEITEEVEGRTEEAEGEVEETEENEVIIEKKALKKKS